MAQERTSGRRVRLRTAFATPELRRCQLAAATSQVVEIAMLVAVSVHLFGRGGASAVATYGVVRTVAPALTTPLVTGAASRVAPGRGLAACVAAGALGVAATAAFVGANGSIALILAAAALVGVAAGSVRALVVSLLPHFIRDPAALVATNTAASMVENLSTITGPLVAGAALATVGASPLLWGTAGAMLVVAVTVWSLRAAAAEPVRRTRLLVEVVEGAKVLVGTPGARLVALLMMSQTFVRGAVNVLVVGLAIDRLGLGDGGVGLLIGMIGVGGLIGLPLAARLVGRGRIARTLGAALVLWGLPLIAVGLLTTDAVVVGLFAVVGVGNALADISSDTLLQRVVPRGLLARALGTYEAALFVGKALGAVVAGQLLLVTDVGPATVVVGALLPVVAVVAAVALRRLDATMRTRDAGIALLQVNAIFSSLVLSAVDHLARSARETTHSAGTVIVTEGAAGDRVYVVESGRAEVRRGGQHVAMLGTGDLFGEMALLDDRPRNATVLARTAVTTRSLGRDDFLSALHTDDGARSAARRLADERRPE